MNNDGKMEFAKELKLSFVMRGKDNPSMALIDRYWELLSRYPVEIVIQAIKTHDKKSQYVPQPVDLIAILEVMDNRPGSEEAWGIAMKGHNDESTVVWTEEIAQASSVCDEQLNNGDKIAARMAFKEKYEELVNVARESMIPVKWTISYGDNQYQRDAVVRDAVRKGRLPVDMLKSLPSPDNGIVKGLINGDTLKADAIADEKAKKHLQALKEALSKPSSKVNYRAEKEKAAREKLAQAKAETEKMIEGKGA